jgi:transcriptional regulator of NAD metabolism
MMKVPSRQTVHNLLNKLRTMGLLIDKKEEHKCRVLNEEKLNDIGAKLEH